MRQTLPLMPSHGCGSPPPEKTIAGAIEGRAHACAAMANCVNSNAAAIKQARNRITLFEKAFKVLPLLLRHYNVALIQSTDGAERILSKGWCRLLRGFRGFGRRFAETR